jgi:hypothetical protein
MTATEEAIACIIAPRMKAKSANKTTTFLPNLSAKYPDTGEIKRAKRAVADVMSDLSSTVSSWPSDEPIDTSVADMTPVSSI